jgi:diamine N-acetyltransferase
VTVRRATQDDAIALAALAAASFRDTYVSVVDADMMDAYVDDNFRPDVVADLLRDPASIVLVAVSAGRLVGYAQLRQSQAPACVTGAAPIQLSRLYVSHDVLGQGIGASLVAAVLEEAAALGRRTLWLSVYEQNPRAIAFYRKRGFTTVGTTEFQFGSRVFIDPVMSLPVA